MSALVPSIRVFKFVFQPALCLALPYSLAPEPVQFACLLVFISLKELRGSWTSCTLRISRDFPSSGRYFIHKCLKNFDFTSTDVKKKKKKRCKL